MNKKVSIYNTILFLVSPLFLSAQHVLYSPSIINPSTSRFEVIGKAGDYYWILKSKKKNSFKKSAEPWKNDKDHSFEIYDARMNLVNIIATSVSDRPLKKYFVAGIEYFDQLTLTKINHKTTALLTRYTADGSIIHDMVTLASFPENMNGNDFLLVQSQDRTKILLLGFEPVEESSPRLHALLYDKEWRGISQTICKDKNISQPYIQYDFINYPLTHFDNSPVKLANSGEWLMVSPSGATGNYLLFHFNGIDSSFLYKQIKLQVNARVSDLVLSLDDKSNEAFVGIMLNTRSRSVKNVILSHYAISQCRFNFDTSYHFNTLAANKTKNENLVEEYFMAVPGKGFMLLKEYGRPWSSTYSIEESRQDDHGEDQTNIVFNNTPVLPLNKNEYTRYNNLVGTRSRFHRGDLSLYYFPATPMDSCWSGIINKEQITELNSSFLSYVFMPVNNKLVFLYNNLFNNNNNNNYSSSTILDQNGNLVNEGLVFWRTNNTLLFQKARQITANELAIPYEKNMRNGFAIIRL